MSTDARTVVAHVALALGSYAKYAARDGRAVPPEIADLGLLLADAVSTRQQSADCASCAARDDARSVTEPELLTREDVSRMLRCSVSTVDRLIRSGTLTSVELAGVRVRRSDLGRYIAELPTRGTPGASFRDSARMKAALAPGAAAAAAVNAAAAAAPIRPAGRSPIVTTEIGDTMTERRQG